MKFDIHLFPVVRVKVCGVEAPDELAAIKAAEGVVDFNFTFNHNSFPHGDNKIEMEYAEEVTCYLVDSEGDPDGVWYGPGYERGDPNPSGTKANLLDRILAEKKLLPMLLGIDPDLDKLIAGELR